MIALLSAFSLIPLSGLTVGTKAPELIGDSWINCSKPISLKAREGKVTVVHFWTFACSNCKANLPAYDRLYKKFKPLGVEFVGVHTPELAEERDERNVSAAVKRLDLKFPVLIDGSGKNWDAWQQGYWPTFYVVNSDRLVQFKWEGEFAYQGATGEEQATKAIQRALKD